MATRRSARVQAQAQAQATTIKEPSLDADFEVPGSLAKRGRTAKSATGPPSKPANQNVELANATSDLTAVMPPPPTTPNKRRRVAQNITEHLPLTPTPSAIGLMTSNSVLRPNWSSGDVDDASPPPMDRPVEPHHTNALLITPGGTQVQAGALQSPQASPSRASRTLVTTARCLLDEATSHLVKVDPKLKPVIDAHRCHVFSPEGLAEIIDPFRSLASGIIGQQVSGAAAKSIKNKFINLFLPEACPTGFPPPSLVAQTEISRLREAGLSQRKAEYIQGLAAKFANGELTIPMLMDGSDEEVMENLVAVRGLGVWSVEMFMCFGLKRFDVFSTGDLGVQRGMAVYKGRDVAKLKAKGGKWKYMSEKEMLEIAEPFRPYRSVFMWYMWHIADVKVEAVANTD